MSQENVEVVRRIYAEWEKGNFALTDAFDPYVRVVWAEPIFAQRAGSMGIREANRNMREFLTTYEQMTATAERVIDAGDSVVVIATWRGRGKASGIEVAEHTGSVWTVSEGRVTRVVTYRDAAKAFEAAGLEE